MSNGTNKNDDASFDIDPSAFDFDPGATGGEDPKNFDFGFDDPPSPGGGGDNQPSFATPVDDGGFDDEVFGSPASAEDATTDFGAPTESAGFAPEGDDFGSGSGDDPFLSQEYIADNATSEGFTESVETAEVTFEEGVDPEEAEPEYSGDDRTFFQKHIFTLGLGVAILCGLGLAYSVVSPLLVPTSSVQQNIPSITDSPTSIPTGPSEPLVADGDRPAFLDQGTVPTLPGFQPPTDPVPLPPAQPSQEPVSLPSVSEPAQDIGLLQPAEPAITSPESIPVPESSSVTDSRIQELESELERMGDRIDSLVARLDELQATPQVAAVPEPLVSPVDKPVVIEGWILRGVQGDVAWIENASSGEFLEISVGSDVPEAGRVTNIQIYEGDWLVVTQSGVILQD